MTKASSAALVAVTIAVSAALFALVPTTAQEGGGRSLEGWWLVQAVLAAALALWLTAVAGWRTALLGATFALGCAGQLGLTLPLWLQFVEMRPAELAAGLRPVALTATALQVMVVVAMLRGRLEALRAGIERLVSWRVALLALAFLFLAGAHASVFLDGFPEPFFVAGYLAQLLAAAAFATLDLVHLWLFACSLPSEPLRRLVAWTSARITLPGQAREEAARPLDHRLPIALAALSLTLSTLVAVVVFERMPHVQDESAFLFQARQLATGAPTSPAPPELEAHSFYLIDSHEGHWHATTKPGWPAMLALGVLLGVPWLVNPLLGAATVLLLHRLTHRLSGDLGLAHLTAAVTATSPWFLFLAGSMMGHTFPLFLTVAGLLLAHAAMASQRWWLAMVSGLCFGLGVLVRPVDGLVVGALAGMWMLYEKGLRLGLLAPFSVGAIVGTLPILPYNRAVAGSPLADPMQMYLDRIWYPGANRLGFGDDIGPPGGWGNLDLRPGHGLFEVAVNANQNLYGIHFELLGWVYLGLAPLFAHLAWGRSNALDRRLWIYSSVLVAVLSTYWFSGGPDFGARYWFLAFLPLAIWSARGVVSTGDRLAQLAADPLTRARTGATVALLMVLSIGVFCTWRATGRYVEYRDVHADYGRLISSGELGAALVLVESGDESEIESALLHNRPNLPVDRPVFVRAPSTDEALDKLRSAYPQRRIVRVRGRRGPNDRVEVLADPTAGSARLSR